MLIIRDEQRRALREGVREAYAREAVRRLRAREPERALALDDQALLALVQGGIAQAERFGIRTRGAVEELLVAVLRLGPEFASRPEHAEVRRVLDMRVLDGRTKADCLRAYLDAQAERVSHV